MTQFRNFKVLNALFNIYATSMDAILEHWDREDREDRQDRCYSPSQLILSEDIIKRQTFKI